MFLRGLGLDWRFFLEEDFFLIHFSLIKIWNIHGKIIKKIGLKRKYIKITFIMENLNI